MVKCRPVRRARLGFAGDQVPLPQRVRHAADIAQTSAVRIVDLQPGLPAARAGLVAGDLILAIDGEPETGVDDIVRVLDGSRIGRRVAVAVLRAGQPVTIHAEPDER